MLSKRARIPFITHRSIIDCSSRNFVALIFLEAMRSYNFLKSGFVNFGMIGPLLGALPFEGAMPFEGLGRLTPLDDML